MQEIKHDEQPAITAGILAGGAGQRVGGQDKGLLSWRGRPMIAAVLARIAPQVSGIMISANRNLAAYRSYGYPVISDASTNRKGPLAGISQLLQASSSDWVLIVACDMPQLPLDLAARLAAKGREQASAQASGSIQPVVASIDGRAQYCCCLLHRSLAAAAQAALQRGEYRLGAWLREQDMLQVAYDDAPECFANLNTLAAIQTAR